METEKKAQNPQATQTSQSNDPTAKKTPWIKTPLAKSILYGVISLICAMLLWGYVLMSQNPTREKTFTNVTVSFESGSEADLSARNLIVSGNISDILSDVSVTVSAPLSVVTKLTAKDITATVNLNDVHDSGPFSLEIRAVCSNGSIVSIEPSHIDVTIDDIVTRTIPISYSFSGEPDPNYWHDDPVLMSSSYVLTGPLADVSVVRRAECIINLDGLIKSVNDSYPLTLIDADGNTIADTSVFIGSLPSVTVLMTVLPYREYEIKIDITDLDILDEYLEIAEQIVVPSFIGLAAEQEVLDSIDGLMTAPLSVNDISAVGSYDFNLDVIGIPADAVVVGSDTNVLVHITVQERMASVVFEAVPIVVEGADDNFSYVIVFSGTDMTSVDSDIDGGATVIISGPARYVDQIQSGDIVLWVDVTGKTSGSSYTNISIQWRIARDNISALLVDNPDLLDVSIKPATVDVTVSINRPT